MEKYANLPDHVIELLRGLKAPGRLVAHLTLVHDVATQLTSRIKYEYPDLHFDEQAVLFGAATHDIGKTSFPAELVGPGSMHEECGAEILKKFGIPDSLARFTRTHASWKSKGVTNEDLLVAIADKIWKGNRQDDLEQALVYRISLVLSKPEWEVFASLDTILSDLGRDADRRLEWQSKFATT
jgi:putative nucleotidyltransferase with HDIG domain